MDLCVSECIYNVFVFPDGQSGLKAVEEERRRKREEENDERRRLLRGPTIHEAAERGNLNRVQELLTHFTEMRE
jgi:hypothetical protein